MEVIDFICKSKPREEENVTPRQDMDEQKELIT